MIPKMVNVNFQPAFNKRDMPEELEKFFDGQGYVLRLVANYDRAIQLLSAENCTLLTRSDIKRLEGVSNEQKVALAESLAAARFREAPDGTFVRGDQVLGIQVRRERDAWTDYRFRETQRHAAAEPEREMIERARQQLPGGLSMPAAAQIPHPYDQVSGGAAEALRQIEAMQKQKAAES